MVSSVTPPQSLVQPDSPGLGPSHAPRALEKTDLDKRLARLERQLRQVIAGGRGVR
jgi:hypothetical protein